jgi:DNA topoisomerase I
MTVVAKVVADLTPEQALDLPEVVTDPVESARAAGLHYCSDTEPGIRRKRAGKHFSYVAPDGTRIRDDATLKRIRSLAIPPAYQDVWICPDPLGHLQATGRDARGRKQYRYHPRWREIRDATKHTRMISFGHVLPVIRRKTEEHLALRGMPREKVLATVVRLLETTLIRVGNEEYAKANQSYGLTTLRNKHAKVEGTEVKFAFRGKSGVKFKISLKDRRLARIVKKCQELPGQALFSYIDEEGNPCAVGSADVNAYLREISGQEITAKDFRTWSATVLAAMALEEMEAVDTKVATRKNVVRAIERVAERLGNTPAVCRKCYVHPAILQAYEEGTLPKIVRERAVEELAENLAELPPEEAAVLAFLKARLERESSADFGPHLEVAEAA